MGWRLKYQRVQRRPFLPADRELTHREYERMVRAAEQSGDERLALLIQTLCALGLRVSELKAVTVESLERGEAGIANKGKLRAILIPDAQAERQKRIGVRLCCHACKNRETAKSRKNALIFVQVFAIL